MLEVEITKAGKAIREPVEVRGILYFENNEADYHISEGIPFVFLLVKGSSGAVVAVICGLAAVLVAAAGAGIVLKRKRRK